MADTLPEPKSRKEQYLAKAAGMDTEIPAEPMSREEEYLNAIAEGGGGGGGGVTPEQLDARVKLNAGAPTNTTVGTVGQLIEDTTNGDLYQCTGITTSVGLDTTAGITSQVADVTFTIANANTFNSLLSSMSLSAGNYMVRKGTGTSFFVSATDSTTNLGTLTGVAVYTFGNTTGITPNPVAAFNSKAGSATANTPIFIFTLSATGDPTYTWEQVGAGPTIVQTTGNSTTDVMSQDATTKMVFYNGDQTAIRLGSHAYPQSSNYNICIGDYSYSGYYGVSVGQSCYTSNTGRCVALGNYANANAQRSIAIGSGNGSNEKALAGHENSIAIGCGASTTVAGQVAVGTVNGIGYNGTAYRLVSGVHDGVDTNDAVTVGQIAALLSELNSALGTSLTITNGVIRNGGGNAQEDPSDPGNTGSGDGGGEAAPEDEPGPE